MSQKRVYVGLGNDLQGGMTPTGNIIRDARVFGLIPETEDCKGWSGEMIDALYDKVTTAWEPYGHLASRLPEELAQRHRRIYDAAVLHARSHGWDPELSENDG